MNRNRTLLGLALVGLFAMAGTTLLGADEVTWAGSYVWERGEQDIPGEIEAVFTPAGEGSWTVMFHFEWEGEQRVWAGDAKGSLTSGELEGKGVEERDRKRTFVFSGKVADGVFEGEHGSMRDGEFNKLGTIRMSAP